jgi:hypothetical protein
MEMVDQTTEDPGTIRFVLDFCVIFLCVILHLTFCKLHEEFFDK